MYICVCIHTHTHTHTLRLVVWGDLNVCSHAYTHLVYWLICFISDRKLIGWCWEETIAVSNENYLKFTIAFFYEAVCSFWTSLAKMLLESQETNVLMFEFWLHFLYIFLFLFIWESALVICFLLFFPPSYTNFQILIFLSLTLLNLSFFIPPYCRCLEFNLKK